MKKTAKVISVILVCAMLVSGLSLFGFAERSNAIPTILIKGQGAQIFKPGGQQVYSIQLPDGKIGEIADRCLPLFKDAVLSGDYSEWSDAIVEEISDIYKDIRLDNNGEATDGSYITENAYSDAQIYERASWYNGSGTYPLSAFEFTMDWRLDPYYNASLLAHRIEVVKAATGSDKVNIIARCEGNQVLVCYMDEYGTADLDSVVMYVSCMDGVEAVSAAFSGNIILDAKTLTEFYNSMGDTVNGFIGDEVIVALLDNTIGFLEANYGLEVACAMLRPILRKLYNEAVYDCMLNSYGTFPGIWTLVSTKDFARAREGMFAGKEEQYAGLLAKIDKYHDRIALHYKDILKNAKKNGLNIYVVSQYGNYTMVPVIDSQIQNDGICGLSNSSMGATCALRGEQLKASYIAAAEKNGTAKYISADKAIDASTCLFPDRTWFIHNVEHRQFTSAVNDFNMMLLASGGMTVFSDENYPAFMHIADGADDYSDFVPLTAENGMQPNGPDTTHSKKNIKEQLFAFLKSLFTIIIRLLSKAKA